MPFFPKGPNIAFVTSHALAHGRPAGVAAAPGITFSNVLMTAMVRAGIGAKVMSWAPAFELLRLAGRFSSMASENNSG